MAERILSLDELLEIYQTCMQKTRSRCNKCILSDEYGDQCYEIKDKESLKYLKELKKLKETNRFKAAPVERKVQIEASNKFYEKKKEGMSNEEIKNLKAQSLKEAREEVSND